MSFFADFLFKGGFAVHASESERRPPRFARCSGGCQAESTLPPLVDKETKTKGKGKTSNPPLPPPPPPPLLRSSTPPASPPPDFTWLSVSTANPTSPTASASVSPLPIPAPALPPGSSSPPPPTTAPSVGPAADLFSAASAPDPRPVL
ncbi:hypothetical protein GQ55_9G430900 [Panicum hallii var. hallii]|uniref:Uncharacterized protein n=1 Tax=Panicum hallii var. hallii TaxID=1504633 RepID=A0A2T7CB19_9POAL|nr:hypothetical protein GQ55_9G430900 [Panicum hallii var. hallii]